MENGSGDNLKWNAYWRDGAESHKAERSRRIFSMSAVLKIAENIMKRGRCSLIRSSLIKYIPEIGTQLVLDVGCGLGRTVIFLRSIGLRNTLGVDWAMEGLKVCQEQGLMIDKDVFQMDCKNTSFKDGEFKLVFSEGILEHYQDFMPLVREMCRISNEYVYILQPDHFTLCGKLRIFALRKLLKGANDEFPELSYRMEEFVSAFETTGYRLVFKRSTFLRNYAVLLFKKITAA